MSTDPLEIRIEEKMRAAAIGEATIRTFIEAHRRVRRGERGMIPELEIAPITSPPALATLPMAGDETVGLLRQLAVFKLNGGLGTGMGLDRTKSLIRVRDGDNFLDFIARQILHLRGQTGGTAPRFVLMNSFTTREETLSFLGKYPALLKAGPIDFLQNKVPKILADTGEPVSWPADPELEWCPPGHGDFYPSLLNSGLLDSLLAEGIRYAFISNSDNLGATVDARLLRYFADSGLSFLMEVAERTAADRKGGHLARRNTSGRLLLRESAQCPKEDEEAFQDITRHQFFNTNNLWIRLDHLAAVLRQNGGTIPLPLITNAKTVDPRDANSPKVLQLESAMGAAIECFEKSGAVVVPRERFSPVKATNDLLTLRSNAYEATADHRLVLADSRHGRPPVVDLDGKHYKVVASFESFFPDGPPSLLHCDSLKVVGPVRFASGVVCEGKVTIRNARAEVKTLTTGRYRDQDVDL